MTAREFYGVALSPVVHVDRGCGALSCRRSRVLTPDEVRERRPCRRCYSRPPKWAVLGKSSYGGIGSYGLFPDRPGAEELREKMLAVPSMAHSEPRVVRYDDYRVFHEKAYFEMAVTP